MAGVKIGLRDVVYALLLDDGEATSGVVTYDTVKPLKGAISANFSPNASNDTLFADDGPYETASTLGAMTLELNVADLPTAIYAEMIGAHVDPVTKVVVNSANDIPPYMAVGMKVKKSNGKDRYIWYLKGKFAAPDESNQTKADSINWNTPTITGNFLKRAADDNWRFAVDTDDVSVPTSVIDNFFESPNVTEFTVVENTLAAGMATQSFSKAAAEDITITVTSTDTTNTIQNVKNGAANIGGVNLTATGLTVVIKKEYVGALDNGVYNIVVEMARGNSVTVALTVAA